jgi:hypothetical protein
MRDDRGAVAAAFSAGCIALCLCMGAAADFSRWHAARVATLSAIDAAILAGGRALQLDPSNQDAALSVALGHYRENVSARGPISVDTISFRTTDDGTAVTADGTAYIATSFLGLANIPRLPLFRRAGADRARAIVAAGTPTARRLEVALLVETSSGMATAGRLADLKQAAGDLVTILVRGTSSYVTARVAVVPYATDIRIAPELVDPVRGSGLPTSVSKSYTCVGPRGAATCTVSYLRTPCVSERIGDERTTDAAPGPGSHVGAVYNTTGHCVQPASNSVLPLSGDRNALMEKLSALTAAGGAAGHLGLAWGWYALSPAWRDVWPAENVPAAADDTETEKIVIVVAGSPFTVAYDAQGVDTALRGAGPAANGSSTAQAEALCGAMRETDIEIFTVALALSGHAETAQVLAGCASDVSHVYTPENGNQLQQALRDIALRLTNLQLTQ